LVLGAASAVGFTGLVDALGAGKFVMGTAPLAGFIELVGALVLGAAFSTGLMDLAGALGAGGFAFWAGRFVLIAV